MSESEDYILELDKFVYGGETMGRLEDGRAVFVPFALPGEKVRIQLVLEKRGFARGKLLEVLKTSPLRTEATCKHFTNCGLCHFQHLSYPEQLNAKVEILKDQLKRLGGIDDPQIETIIASTGEWNYSNQIKLQQTPSGELGFRSANIKKTFRLEECFIPQDALNEFWPSLTFGPLADLKSLELRLGKNDDLMMVLNSYSDEAYELEVDFPIKVIQVGPESVHVMSDTYFLDTELLGRNFRVSAISFYRPNIPVVEKMIYQLLNDLPISPEVTLVEAYSGVGTFSAFLASKVGRLIGIEKNPAAAKDFSKNLDEFDNVEIYEDLAEYVLPNLDVRVDIMLVDPPKAGLAPKVLDGITKISPRVLAYISSDPATLARDTKRLIHTGYNLKKITAYDLRPQTFHIDSISIWEKE